MEMFCVCAVQCNSHQPHVAVEQLKVALATEELNFSFCLNLNNHIWLMATGLETNCTFM